MYTSTYSQRDRCTDNTCFWFKSNLDRSIALFSDSRNAWFALSEGENADYEISSILGAEVKEIRLIIIYIVCQFYRTELYSDVPRDEAENWIRLAFLLINKGTPCLRKIIRHWLEKKNLTFDILLDHNKRNFTERAPMFEKDKLLLYPPVGTRPKDLMERLNFTLLVLLIINFKVFQMGPPNGWAKVPDPKQTDPASDIIRLRLLRNELYHSPLCAIANDEFKDKWTTLTDVLMRLGAVDRTIHGMKTCHFSQLRAQRKAYSKMIRELFSKDKYFAQKFIENTSEHLPKREKLEVWMNAKDQGLRQKVAFEAMGYQSGYQSGHESGHQSGHQSGYQSGLQSSYRKAKRCTKCNRLSNTICSHCSCKPEDTAPEKEGRRRRLNSV